MRFVATVEPCTKSAQLPSTSPTLHPSSQASCSRAAITPRLGSDGTDRTLTTMLVPVLSVSTRSVNVPPTSMPMRQGGWRAGELELFPSTVVSAAANHARSQGYVLSPIG